MQAIRKYKIKYYVSGPRRPNENPAEQNIHEVKKRWYRVVLKKKVPPRLWDYGFTWICELKNICANMSKYANGCTPFEIITGETPDISECLDFEFYDWVLYQGNAGLGEIELARWLGVSHRVGRLMSYWILPESGIPVSATTVQRMTNDERSTDEMRSRMTQYEDKLKVLFEIPSATISNGLQNVDPSKIIDPDNKDNEFFEEFMRTIDNSRLRHADDEQPMAEVTGDTYLGMELAMPRSDEGEMVHATVKRRLMDEEGLPVGRPSLNPLLDSSKYEVEYYADGYIEQLTAKIIAENLIAQIDDEGRRRMMFSEIIVNHRVLPDDIPQSQGTYENAYGIKRKKATTRGWQVLVEWRDGSTDWIELKDLMESYPMELAMYAVNHKIADEPAFAWWVPYVLKKQKQILQKVKTKYWSRTHKYGIRIPKNT